MVVLYSDLYTDNVTNPLSLHYYTHHKHTHNIMWIVSCLVYSEPEAHEGKEHTSRIIQKMK